MDEHDSNAKNCAADTNNGVADAHTDCESDSESIGEFIRCAAGT